MLVPRFAQNMHVEAPTSMEITNGPPAVTHTTSAFPWFPSFNMDKIYRTFKTRQEADATTTTTTKITGMLRRRYTSTPFFTNSPICITVSAPEIPLPFHDPRATSHKHDVLI